MSHYDITICQVFSNQFPVILKDSYFHFPAIDVLASVSRVMSDVVVDEHMAANRNMRALMAVYKEAEDLIHIGAYVKGSSKKIDEAIEKIDAINGFLCQGVFEQTTFEQTIQQLEGI